jgi:phospholipase C
MIHRIAVFCSLLLGPSLGIGIAGCGYTANIRGPEEVVTPTGQIRHVVIIFQENVSFDHYFGTIEQTPEWNHTVIILAYDDSDGWYDHVYHVIHGSETSRDGFSAIGRCGDPSTALPGVEAGTLHAQGRCGYGPRLPLLVISPWAKPNYVSHTVTDQTSILRFLEDTFLNQQPLGHGSYDSVAGSIADMLDFSAGVPQNSAVVLLDSATGQVKSP